MRHRPIPLLPAPKPKMEIKAKPIVVNPKDKNGDKVHSHIAHIANHKDKTKS